MSKFSKKSGFIRPFNVPWSSTGFTTVEFLVTVFIFSLMALTTTSILVRALDIERKAFGAQVVQENALAVFELMAKEIRIGTITNQDSNCTATTLSINHPTVGMITYQLASGVVQRLAGGVTYIVSSSDVAFNNLRFCILGTASPSDNRAARVAIIASISNLVGRGVYTVNIQTTVASRDIVDELQN